MTRLQFIKAKAIDARKNYSWGSSVREVWFKDDSGKESAIEFSGPFPVRSGNLLGLVYDQTRGHYLAIANFSTEMYFNFCQKCRAWSTTHYQISDGSLNGFFVQRLPVRMDQRRFPCIKQLKR